MDTNIEKAQALGWLDEDGICRFPDDVLGIVLGYRALSFPITALAEMTSAQLMEAVHKGWILFSDSNADYYTFADYVLTYPALPDPIFQLTVRGKWPPTTAGVKVLGGR